MRTSSGSRSRRSTSSSGTWPSGGPGTVGEGKSRVRKRKTPPPPEIQPGPNRFYASVELSPMTCLCELKDLSDNIIQHLVQAVGAKVTVRLDIEATHRKGFDRRVQRTVRENAKMLGLTDAAFEQE